MESLTGLVLEGGGARGAFECGAIARLYQDPEFGIQAVAGASIGAINAACLVGGRTSPGDVHPADGTTPGVVEELWRRLKEPELDFIPFPLDEAYKLAGNHFSFLMPTLTAAYSTAPMRQLLTELIDFDRLNQSEVKVTVIAVDVESGERTEFCNWNGMKLHVDHIMASASLPPMYPMTQIGGRQFWDGALFDNAPMQSVIEALAATSPDDQADLTVYLLQLLRSSGKIPRTPVQVYQRELQILMTNKLEEDADRTQQISDYVKLVRELTAALPPAAAKSFRKNELYTRLSKHRYVDLVRIGMLPGGFTSAEFDFSASTIDARIAEGYEATDRAIRGRNGKKDAVGRKVPVGSVSA